MDAAQLGPQQREQALDRLASETFDVLVIGGGVTGTGVALDAATRGLSVALVEARDYAAGTSSRSTKLFHGGLRYLEKLDFKLVFEALHERDLMLDRLCPHLASPVAFLLPLRHRMWERAYLGSGVALYDLMARVSKSGRQVLPRHRHLTKTKALELFPSLSPDYLIGAIRYYDAQVDDARHTMEIARTAAHYGAVCTTSTRAVDFIREGNRVAGARVRDVESGRELDVRARTVVNAGGVWIDEVQRLAGRGRVHINPSKGIHLVVPKDRIQADLGLIMRTETSVLFIVPWGRHWIIGTTDTAWDLDRAHPAASSADIDYLLEHVNEVLVNPLDRSDIEGIYSGLRPLLSGESEEATANVSREHAVSSPVDGLVTIAGGKYTTYRVMARDAVDAAAKELTRKVPPSCTEEVPLIGAAGYTARWNQRERIAADTGLHPARVEHLLRRYGSRLDDVLALVTERPELGEPIPGAEDYLLVEVTYATSHEGALHLEDVLTRRTRISLETFDRGEKAAEPAARLMGEVLGWDDEARKREIEHYYARLRAEREAEQSPDDSSANAARSGAQDIRVPV